MDSCSPHQSRQWTHVHHTRADNGLTFTTPEQTMDSRSPHQSRQWTHAHHTRADNGLTFTTPEQTMDSRSPHQSRQWAHVHHTRADNGLTFTTPIGFCVIMMHTPLNADSFSSLSRMFLKDMHLYIRMYVRNYNTYAHTVTVYILT